MFQGPRESTSFPGDFSEKKRGKRRRGGRGSIHGERLSREKSRRIREGPEIWEHQSRFLPGKKDNGEGTRGKCIPAKKRKGTARNYRSKTTKKLSGRRGLGGINLVGGAFASVGKLAIASKGDLEKKSLRHRQKG